MLKDLAKAALDSTELPLGARLYMTRRGFKPSNYVLYGLPAADLAAYAPDTWWRRLCETNGRGVTAVLGNKLLFYYHYRDRLPLPSVHGYLARGAYVPLDPAAPGTVTELLHDAGALVFKPVDGQKGKHVHLLREGADGTYALDGRHLSEHALAAWLVEQDGMLVQERVEQAPYAAEVFPDAANTVRLVTVAGEDEPFVLLAGHRFGTAASAPVDNFAAGGLLAVIDERTGVLGPAAAHPVARERTVVWHDHHPDTGAAIAGRSVPGFSGLVELLLRFCAAEPHLAYIGWDVVLTERGPVVLEANYGSGLQMQLVKPFLSDPRFVAFAARHGLRS